MLKSSSSFSVNNDRRSFLDVLRSKKDKKPRPLSHSVSSTNLHQQYTAGLDKYTNSVKVQRGLDKEKENILRGSSNSTSNSNTPVLRTRASLPQINKSKRHTVFYTSATNLGIPLGAQSNPTPPVLVLEDTLNKPCLLNDSTSTASEETLDSLLDSPYTTYSPTSYFSGIDSLDSHSSSIVLEEEALHGKTLPRSSDISLILKYLESTAPEFAFSDHNQLEMEKIEQEKISKSLQDNMMKEESKYTSTVDLIGNAVFIGVQDTSNPHSLLDIDYTDALTCEPYEDRKQDFYLMI